MIVHSFDNRQWVVPYLFVFCKPIFFMAVDLHIASGRRLCRFYFMSLSVKIEINYFAAI